VPITEGKVIWMDGELVPWGEARVHILTHALHYGYGVFEGIRAYATARGSAVFRLREHLERLHRSAHMLLMEIPYSVDELQEATKTVIRENGEHACYIRPVAFTGYGEMGLSPLSSSINVSIATWPWGAYLGEEGIAKGVRAKISSWRRHDPNVIPPAAKVTGGYVNSALAKAEAIKAGYDEAILLSPQGYVSECTGENLFAVIDGILITPPLAAGALAGITRRTVLALAADAGIEVREANLLRSDLYIANEVFLSGTAAEVVPIASVDDRPVGNGNPGPVTREMQRRYYAAVRGEDPAHEDWLDYVDA
jgi:branched-chain amino acid aminotransferase